MAVEPNLTFSALTVRIPRPMLVRPQRPGMVMLGSWAQVFKGQVFNEPTQVRLAQAQRAPLAKIRNAAKAHWVTMPVIYQEFDPNNLIQWTTGQLFPTGYQ